MKSRTDRLLDNLEKAMGSLVLCLFGMSAYLTLNAPKLHYIQIIIISVSIICAILILAILVLAYKVGLDKLSESQKDKKG